MIAPALHKIADYLKDLAVAIERGEVIPSDDLRLAARRLEAQAEMLDECGE
jgi:hypothetical protein